MLLLALVIPAAAAVAAASASAAAPCGAGSPLAATPVCDLSASPRQRAAALAARLTVTEKAQLMSTGGAGGGAGAGVARLRVPGFPTGEGLHGVVGGCAQDPARPRTGACPTSFPHALALAAGFSRSSWRLVGSTISLEARALRNSGSTDVGLVLFAPDINLVRDPRWGRGQETSGEDPALTSEYAMAFIPGLQQRDAAGVLRAAATPKHYSDYDVEGNRGSVDRGSVSNVVTPQDQSRYYWPQWRAAAQGANAKAVMCSYPAVGGIPSCGNRQFLDGVLRKQFHYDGLVVTDCGALDGRSFFCVHRAAAQLVAGAAGCCGAPGWRQSQLRWLVRAVATVCGAGRPRVGGGAGRFLRHAVDHSVRSRPF